LIVGAGLEGSPFAGGAGAVATGAAFTTGALSLAAFESLVGFPEHPPSRQHSVSKTARRCPQLTLPFETQFILREILSLCNLAGRRYLSFFSARALRCFGCTSQAMPMLKTYSATIGAAKMHMFRMSVVGVRIAAMMKITRIE